MGAAKSDVILDADFDEGDRVILGSYDAGTFSSGGGGANVFADGGAVIVRSLEGLEGLAAASADVTLEVGPDGLTLAVAQASGLHEILLVPAPEPGSAPAPGPSPDGGGEGPDPTHRADLALIADAIGRGDHAGLAGDLGMTLKTGRGDAQDNVVLADPEDGRNSAKGYAGDDVLVGDARDNWLIVGSGNEILHGGDGADDFRFSGDLVGAAKSDVILDADFDEGDRVILGSYDAGTFSSGGGANVFAYGGAVIVRSLEGLEGLAAASADVTLETGPDGLTLAVAQSSGLHEILLV